MCFEVALMLALLSRRTLVIPDGYRRLHEKEGDEFRPLHPRDFISFESLDNVMPSISAEVYRARRRYPRDRVKLRFQPGEAVFCYPSPPRPDDPAHARLHAFAAGRKLLLHLTSQQLTCETLEIEMPALEHFYTFYFVCNPHEARAQRRFVRDHVHFPLHLIQLARAIAGSLGHYNAMHLRRGDFFQCFPHLAVPDSHILGRLLATLPRELPLYVATDEPGAPFLNVLRRYFRVCVATDFFAMRTMPAEYLACLEQLMCAFAHSFIGTRLSTFSAYITRLRGYVRAPDLEVRFTDGAWNQRWDDVGRPLFSWTNWLRHGLPLWGREFREGWEV
jgi:hypothetical protein